MTEHADPGRRGHAGARTGRYPPPDLDEPNYYELLGVSFTASSAEIARAYRIAMKRIHPDRQRSERRAAAEEEARLLNRAYATLSKPLMRQQYDRTIRAQVLQDQIMSRYVGGFMPPANGHDPLADQLRREPTAAGRREQAQANRNAFVSLLAVFVVITVVMMGALLLWALIESLLNVAF